MNTRYFWRLAAAMTLVALPLAAGSITTSFADNNFFTGNMFNATIGAHTITVNSLAVNVDSAAITVDVYLKTGSYSGFETSPAAWTLVSATAVTGLGEGKQTPVSVTPFTLASGTSYGVYVTLASTAHNMYYTNGVGSYSNADLSLSLGDGLGGLFGATSLFADRSWDGTINYTLATLAAPEPATVALMALAIPGLWVMRRYFLKY